MIRIGVVGYGYWGPNLARNIRTSRAFELAAICDPCATRREKARIEYPDVAVSADWQDIIDDPEIDAVAVATPVETHFEIGVAALQAGKHTLVEKPMARTAEQAMCMLEESERGRAVLMVDHTYVFAPAIRTIRSLLSHNQLGQLWYFDSNRLNLGLVRRDVNVLWDLASHDLAILDYLLPQPPTSVMATGISPGPGQQEDLAHLTLFYPDGLIAHINVSWMSPVKVRRTLIGGSRRMLLYDDLEEDKVTVYDSGFDRGSDAANSCYRRGEVWTPPLGQSEPLLNALEHFGVCIVAGNRPETDAAAGLRVVRLLEAADRSLAEGSRIVALKAEGVLA